MKLRGGTKLVTCPHCGRRFDITYARVTACSGCSYATIGCNYVKCPFCGYEFMIS